MEERKEEDEAEIQEHRPSTGSPSGSGSAWPRPSRTSRCPLSCRRRRRPPRGPSTSSRSCGTSSRTRHRRGPALDPVCQQPGLSLWVPFRNAAAAVTNLYKESVDTHQRSFDIGIQIVYQRRNKDVLARVKKGRRTIPREDLISFLCGKGPPPRSSRAAPRLTAVSPNRATSRETSSSVD
ncbi:UPF0472 protein C16orf72-like protein [Sciurus carolinensis]|uniref:UPF0472 protein C16orf72-like protein n=1 Tax=Sciurus carolinensis TaxID=30640 RepID=A0AA41NC21_SCICA|nr:UPF0472 protein C16orf72-like protein [Sciurus carolinensis]